MTNSNIFRIELFPYTKKKTTDEQQNMCAAVADAVGGLFTFGRSLVPLSFRCCLYIYINKRITYMHTILAHKVSSSQYI